MLTETKTEAGTIAALAEAARKGVSEVITADGRHLLILPTADGYQTEDITDPLREIKPPPSIIQGVTVQSLDSLVDYANRFKTPNTVLFADLKDNAIHAALDYHGPDQPSHVTHAARMALPFSVEWTTWAGIDGKLMEQLEFARFLEENAVDIVAPSGADLLEVCRDLQAIRKVNFVKAVRTDSDNESFEYTDETQATTRKGDVDVPTKFKLEIPVYFGERPTELYAFLRWRLEEGAGLKLGVKLHRPEHVRQAVFKQIVLGAADRIVVPAVFGKVDSLLFPGRTF